MTRLALARHAPQHIEHYAEQTRRVVDDLAAQLQVLFEDERAGRMSPSWARILDRLFALWCEQSGIVAPDTARSVLEDVDAFSLSDVLKAVRVDLGFSSDEVTRRARSTSPARERAATARPCCDASNSGSTTPRSDRSASRAPTLPSHAPFFIAGP